LSERFELFTNGLEIVNAYTEQNDPVKQREMFALQGRDNGQASESIENESYIKALEHGLPPTAGWGLGIDRLVMLLAGQTNIRQVYITGFFYDSFALKIAVYSLGDCFSCSSTSHAISKKIVASSFVF